MAALLLKVRPRRIAIYAVISATLVLAGMIVVGLLLRQKDLGVAFQTSDQIGLIGLGVIIAGLIGMMARPRLLADETGIWVRNILGENYYQWPLVLQIAFPEGSNWAQLILPDDETHALMAIQALDKGRAVTSLRKLRALHAKYAPPPPAPPPSHMEELKRIEEDRPLGRLEIIDRQMAAKGGKAKGKRPAPKK